MAEKQFDDVTKADINVVVLRSGELEVPDAVKVLEDAI